MTIPTHATRARQCLVRLLGQASGLVVLALLLLFWEWYAASRDVFFLPTPAEVWANLRTDWLTGDPSQLYLTDQGRAAVRQTFTVAVSGWLIGSFVGILVGAVLGTSRRLREYVEPPLVFLRSVPPVAVIPICIVLLGLGTRMNITVVAFGSLWPILLNTTSGVADIEPVQREVARLVHLGPVATLRRVLLPAASPRIFAGLRIGLALAIIIAVGAELFAGTGGLGGAALGYQTTFNVPGLWATLGVIAVFGLVVNTLFLAIERSALRWHTQRRFQ